MAISGSLNFLSASLTGAVGINLDFVGLNTLIVDPVSASANTLGYDGQDAIYFNDHIGSEVAGHQLNSILLNRNGPYQHPSWKQVRGGDHPVARKLRLNNTMSIDINEPNAVRREYRKARERDRMDYFLKDGNPHEYVNERLKQLNDTIKTLNKTGELSGSTFVANLQQFYEPPVSNKYKPLVYSIPAPGGKMLKIRASLMNQMTFFANEKVNQHMHIAGPTKNTSSLSPLYLKQDQYKLLSSAKKFGAKNFVYSQTIFPKSINAFRTYTLQKAAYEEVAGTGPNGFDRTENRSFWRSSQGGLETAVPASGTTRTRTTDLARNSQDILQEMHWRDSLPDAHTRSRALALFATGSTFTRGVNLGVHEVRPLTGPDGGGWNFKYFYAMGGILETSGSDNNCPTAPFYTLEAYNPYRIALLSTWPLDSRPDIFSKPRYLTSSIGGNGSILGLTPHRMPEFDPKTQTAFASLNAVFTQSFLETGGGTDKQFGAVILSPSLLDGPEYLSIGSSSLLQLDSLMTGTAGELAYSTKPTIFFHPTKSIDVLGDMFLNGVTKGYRACTASMQYNRHTFPYNSPFYATNKIRGRSPFFNSYSDFAQDIELIARDYSIIPEYRVSDNIDYYMKTFFKAQPKDRHLYSEEKITSVKNFYGDQVFDNAKIIKRNVNLFIDGKIHPTKTKVNFLKLDGAFLTSSAPAATSSQVYSTSNFVLDSTHIRATAATLKNPDIRYSQDAEAVIFNESFSHTEPATEASNLIDAPFAGGLSTVPSKIRITAHALKKLLPYKEFYPVTKTVDIGNKFKKFVYDNIDVGKSAAGMSASYNAQPDLQPGMLQAFLEPLFAPGILYNSIKSGLAVDYPIYKTDRPIYFAPSIYYSGSLHPSGTADTIRETWWDPEMALNRASVAAVISASVAAVATPSDNYLPANGPAQTRHNFLGYASSSFNYGGFQMMGASRCIPAILNNPPSHRMPFEALYKPHLLNQFAGETNALYLTTDFLDLDLNWPSIEEASGSWNPHSVAGMTTKNHPGAAHTRTGPRAVLKKQLTRLAERRLYESSINNFLCETMKFFLKDQEFEGVKMPIIMSKKKTNYFVDITASLYMELSLEMGAEQIMCEGPRNAGIGGGSLVNNKFSNSTDKNTMRGYIYGPPIEVVRMSGSTTIEGKDIVQTDGTLVRQEPLVAEWYGPVGGSDPGGVLHAPHEIESYFGANLQDPAYQAFTPPYFYGKSSIIFSAERHESALTSFDTILDRSKKDSSYVHEYVTGAAADMTGLCKLIPGESSVSGYYSTRMNLESSMDAFKTIKVIDNRAGGEESSLWYMMPKWVCPVLDFSSSFSYLEKPVVDQNTGEIKHSGSLLTNTYHDNSTGKGLWGGYGTDPYDQVAYKLIPNSENTEKGLTLTIRTPFTEEAKKIVQAVNRNDLNQTEGRSIVRRYTSTALGNAANSQSTSGSLAVELGFLENEQDERTYNLGQIASSKVISEAIVVVPYFDKPIKLNGKKGIGKTGAALPHGELFSTREIIPGKHFLPIHKMLFENLLSMKLAMDRYPIQALLPGEANPKPEYVGFESVASIMAAKQTDVFKMIDALHGTELSDDSGYELPPEFDFINYKVDPFQMFVIPIEHTLNKQELIDIYQGIMPDSSMKFEKTSVTVEVNPVSLVPTGFSWMPTVPINTNESVSLGKIFSHNFLNPAFLYNPDLMSLVYQNNQASLWLKNSRDFYKNLKFMTFKVKKRAAKNYDNYKARQIEKVIEEKVFGDVLPKDRDKVSLAGIDTRRTLSDVFGYNWPYDDFSLVEAAKIDIEFEVES